MMNDSEMMLLNLLKKLGVYLCAILSAAFLALVFASCGGGDNVEPKPVVSDTTKTDTVEVLDPSKVDASKIYIPEELKKVNFYKSSSAWYYGRSKQSDHFIVFWASGYGKKDPGSAAVPATYRVDIDDLLAKAELFYKVNIDELKFAQTGIGKSNLDKYKMMIFVYYQTEWLATGSGYDDTIGALWVSPSTCQPVGSTIGHEIGHSFQYQVFCDLGGSAGFRYGFGGNGGNTFWEQTAQWQSLQSYPNQIFTSYDLPVYVENYHRHVFHELYRYASYFIHYYWTDKHGIDMIGKIWREAKKPEDPIQAYMRLTGINDQQLNDEIYDAASKMVTWDLDAIRSYGADYIGAQTFKSSQLEDGSYQVSYDRCPGTTGYNVIRLNVPEAGTEIAAAFTGLVNEPGYNVVTNPARAGWRYGYVALLKDGTRVYGDMNSGTTNTVGFVVPDNCDKLWFVVTGAPTTYAPHPWDEVDSNDEQWPYKVKFANTALFGDIVFSGSEVRSDATLNFDISFPVSADTYPGGTIQLSDDDRYKMAKAFVLQPSQIASALGSSIKFYGVESNGTLNAQLTANGQGHWFDVNGNIIGWSAAAMVYSEFSSANWSFTLGQYPGHVKAGEKYTVKQALVYEYETGKTVQVTFVFNITLK